ncbi:MAG TPA: hypothetical protein VF108_03050 [Actinomycetota bacterium]
MRCEAPASTIVVGVGEIEVTLDLCEGHLDAVLEGARREDRTIPVALAPASGPIGPPRARGPERAGP